VTAAITQGVGESFDVERSIRNGVDRCVEVSPEKLTDRRRDHQ
jgi:hypothetical protein